MHLLSVGGGGRGTLKREGRPVPRKDSCLATHSTEGSWVGAALAVYTHISADLTPRELLPQ